MHNLSEHERIAIDQEIRERKRFANPDTFLGFELMVRAADVYGGHSHRDYGTATCESVVEVLPVHLLVDPGCAPNFVIDNLQLGRYSHMAGATALPASVFVKREDELPTRYEFVTVQPGVPIQIGVRNISGADCTFRAMLACIDISSIRRELVSKLEAEKQRAKRVSEQADAIRAATVIPAEAFNMGVRGVRNRLRCDEHGYALVRPDLNHPHVKALLEVIEQGADALDGKVINPSWPDTANAVAKDLRLALKVWR